MSPYARRILTAVDELWVTDITHIRQELEFVHLPVILEACSRRVIGWALDRRLKAKLALAAPRVALAQRQVKPG